MKFNNGDIVEHYKREVRINDGSISPSSTKYVYRIITTNACNASDDSWNNVVYQAMYGDREIFIRDGVDFCSTVLINGDRVNKFRLHNKSYNKVVGNNGTNLKLYIEYKLETDGYNHRVYPKMMNPIKYRAYSEVRSKITKSVLQGKARPISDDDYIKCIDEVNNIVKSSNEYK